MIATPMRVGSMPGRHPFVDALLDLPGIDRRLPDGRGGDGPTDLHAAIPPLRDLDVLVANFGFEGHGVRELRRLLHDAARDRCAVVTVVHDLVNPHLPPALQERHRRQLTMLVDSARVVATLSDHARERLERVYEVDAMVLPHPALGPAVVPPRTSPGDRVTVHLKSLRRNVMATEAVKAVTGLVGRRTEAAPSIGIHEDARVGLALRSALSEAERRGVEVRRHPRLTDDELVDRLLATDVLLLPYSHGTHSGLLDLALDLGTRVVAPATGAYREQGATATFRSRSRDVVRSMRRALQEALEAPAPPPRDHAARRAAFDAARDELWRRAGCAVEQLRAADDVAVVFVPDPVA